MKLVRPVMGAEERDAAALVLRAVSRKSILVEHDADLVASAAEALEIAPVQDGDKSELNPKAKQLGKFARASETSRLAALENYPRSGSQRQRILVQLLRVGERGATREELAERLSLPDNSVRPRVRELIDGGWVVVDTRTRDDKAVTRRSKLGNDSEVLIPTGKARARASKQAQGRAVHA